MKLLTVFFMLISASSVFALDCIDIRAALFTPCDGGETRLFVQGACEKSYQAESTYCAVEGRPECIDARVVRFAACPRGKTRIFVKGQCKRSYEIEHTYCAKR